MTFSLKTYMWLNLVALLILRTAFLNLIEVFSTTLCYVVTLFTSTKPKLTIYSILGKGCNNRAYLENVVTSTFISWLYQMVAVSMIAISYPGL